MKKNKKKSSSSVTPPEEKGAVTQEMDAVMEAASEDTAEIGIILDSQNPVSQNPDSQNPVSQNTDSAEAVSQETVSQETTPEIPTEEPENAPKTVSESTDPTAEEIPQEKIPQPVDENPAEDTSASDETLAEDISTEDTSEEEPSEPDESADTADTPASGEPAGYKKLGLYLHIPFCKNKCAYCDFYSTDKIVCTGHKVPEEMKLYANALKNHMRILSERTTQYNVDTVFIGGGTPTALPAKLLLDIVKEVERCFYLEDGYEFTVEMNPATADAKLLKKLRRAGVNRLSIGLQSSHNHELAALSRIHSTGDFTECFQMAREAGFDNINVDVMYGIPEQTKETFMETLSFVAAMKPEHISMYNLRIEDGTPFGEKKHMLPLPDEDTECDMYFDGIEYLSSQGYKQYEISNFAREGKECRHNLRYWHGEEYLGCGPAAHSYFGGTRFSLKRSLAQYCKALEVKGKSLPSSLLDENYPIDKKEEIAEYLMLRLRLSEGISTDDFKARFGGDFDAVFGKKLQFYIDNGFMTHENGRYAFTPQGMFVSNHILARIIPFEPKFKG